MHCVIIVCMCGNISVFILLVLGQQMYFLKCVHVICWLQTDVSLTMCELLPPISEDVTIPDDQVLSNSKVEHLMMTMLDEKDKLMDDLQKAKEDYDKISRKLAESQADKEALLRQLKVLLPQVCVCVCACLHERCV